MAACSRRTVISEVQHWYVCTSCTVFEIPLSANWQKIRDNNTITNNTSINDVHSIIWSPYFSRITLTPRPSISASFATGFFPKNCCTFVSYPTLTTYFSHVLAVTAQPGWDEPTAMQQTARSMGTLARHNSVIPRVAFLLSQALINKDIEVR